MSLEVRSRIPAVRRLATPVLLVHGAWHGAWCWDEGFLDDLAVLGVEAHAMSLRGHGESRAVRSLRRTSLGHYIDDVGEVAGRFPTPPVIVGHSMGGFVVQHYLAQGRTAAGGVLVAPVPVTGAVGATLRVARRTPAALVKTIATMRLWHVVATPELAHRSLFSDDVAPEDAARHHARLQDESFLAYLQMMFHRPRAARVEVPVMVIGAGRDEIFSVSEIEKTARAYGTEAVIFPAMGHAMMLEPGRDAVAAAIVEWMERQEEGER